MNLPLRDGFSWYGQELRRLGSAARCYGDWNWPLAYGLGLLSVLYFKVRGDRRAEDVACFGWHGVAVKRRSVASDKVIGDTK